MSNVVIRIKNHTNHDFLVNDRYKPTFTPEGDCVIEMESLDDWMLFNAEWASTHEEHRHDQWKVNDKLEFEIHYYGVVAPQI